MQLIKHQYTNKQNRYYINSKRVSHEYYEYTIIRLRSMGMMLNSFVTKQVNKEHAKHYACI